MRGQQRMYFARLVQIEAFLNPACIERVAGVIKKPFKYSLSIGTGIICPVSNSLWLPIGYYGTSSRYSMGGDTSALGSFLGYLTTLAMCGVRPL
jgi:hypothetical protein